MVVTGSYKSEKIILTVHVHCKVLVDLKDVYSLGVVCLIRRVQGSSPRLFAIVLCVRAREIYNLKICLQECILF